MSGSLCSVMAAARQRASLACWGDASQQPLEPTSSRIRFTSLVWTNLKVIRQLSMTASKQWMLIVGINIELLVLTCHNSPQTILWSEVSGATLGILLFGAKLGSSVSHHKYVLYKYPRFI